MNSAGIRLQKFLSERGIGSRRACAEWISQGRVTVNGETITQPGARIHDDRDKVAFDGAIVASTMQDRKTILLYKPRGYICSKSSAQGKTIYDLRPSIPGTLLPAGRLDKDSEGLLLLTNDGNLHNRLTHPRFGHEKKYHATVSGREPDAVIGVLTRPIEIDGKMTRPAGVKCLRRDATSTRYILEFVLHEGRNRQIRQLCATAGVKLHKLVRVEISGITLSGLKPGRWRQITPRELAILRKNR